MPTFAQHPFNLSMMPAPETTSELLTLVTGALYSHLVERAENLAETSFMVGVLDGETAPDMSIDEIRAFQLGAVCALTVFIETCTERELLDSAKLAAFVVELLTKDGKL